MPLPQPEFDSRKYRDIVTEALARIPIHNPEWTNQLDSDPGVTLLQLFAFMTESIIYRANLIPERNRMKFLRLLGIPMRPAEAATGLVAFSNPKGALTTRTLSAETDLQAGAVPFRTENGLDVLPIDATLYYKSPLTEDRLAEVEETYRRLYASFETAQQALDFYETRSFELPEAGTTLPVLDVGSETRDQAVWLALFARRGDDPDVARDEIAGKTLSLGILPALDEEGCVVYPIGTAGGSDELTLVFETPNTESDDAAYTPMRAVSDADPLERPGVVQLALPDVAGLRYWSELDPLEAGTGRYPPALDDDESQQLISWIRIRARQTDAVTGATDATEENATDQTGSGAQLKIALSWVGINAARVVQRASVTNERLPDGTGEPDQTAKLVNTPVIPETLALTVNGETWSEIDDLAAAPSEVPPRAPRLASSSVDTALDPGDPRVFTLDIESGEVQFGDGARGMRPPFGAVIQASYCYGGGSEGVIGTGALNRGSVLPPGVEVTNPVPTWGGAAAETVEEAESRIPNELRHRNRLVSKEDFEEVARGTPGVELGRVEVLPLYHPGLPNQASDGVVTVLVIPAHDPDQPDAPVPDRLFLETVCRHLEPRRLVTTELHIRGPVYRSIWVSVGIDIVPGNDIGPVRQAVIDEVKRFLSPLQGGFDGAGWPLQKSVEALEVWAAATRVEGVAKVNELLLAGPGGGETERVEMAELELPRLIGVEVASGDATPIGELLGEAEVDEDALDGIDVVPVPVIPEEC